MDNGLVGEILMQFDSPFQHNERFRVDQAGTIAAVAAINPTPAKSATESLNRSCEWN
jgi:hypothetical protein